MSNFILDTDKPIDKIAWLWEGEISIDQDQGDGLRYGSVTINHGIGAQVFASGIWSTDNWQTTYVFGGQLYEIYNGSLRVYQSSSSASDDQKVIAGITIKSASNVTAKARLWGFVNEEETKGLDLNPNGGLSQNRFTINTDFNYPKLYQEGYCDRGGVVDFGRRFDTIPYIEVWGKTALGLYTHKCADTYLCDAISGFNSADILVFNDSVIFDEDSSLSLTKYYYRIYEP